EEVWKTSEAPVYRMGVGNISAQNAPNDPKMLPCTTPRVSNSANANIHSLIISSSNMTGKAKTAPSNRTLIMTGLRLNLSDSCEANQTTTTVEAAPKALTHNTWVASRPSLMTYEIAHTVIKPCTV